MRSTDETDATSRSGPIPSKDRIARGVPWVPAAALLAASVLSVYWQTGSHGFINLDDRLYVVENPAVLRGLTVEGVRWAFSTFHAANWHPLTWLSHMLDVELFGPSAGWHHRVNVLLHLLNTEILFLVLWRMTGGMWRSAFAAALFGVHPLHVESVAWVAERKDLLSALFWFLAMGAYMRYARRPCVVRYLPVVALFALSLLCKPMAVTLPFGLLLLDWWPLGRLDTAGSPGSPAWWTALSRLAREKVPLLGLSAISCAITFLAQANSGAVYRLESIPFGLRISNTLVSYVAYLGKTFWPSSLAVFYPHPVSVHAGIPPWEVAGSIALLGGLSALALWQGRRRPYLAVGWLWFLGTLVPVIGLVQVGTQAMADRYTYVPLIGIFLALAWGVPGIHAGWRHGRLALGALGGAATLALSAAAWSQAGYWRDDITLFSRALAVTEKNWIALNGLGTAYDNLGRYPQAIDCYREALRFKPDYSPAWYNLGLAHARLGQYPQAIDNLREALRIRPEYAEAWNNLGASYEKLGHPRLAIGCYREALRIQPDYVDAWNNLAVSFYNLGEYRQAIDTYRKVLQIKPDYAEAWYNMGKTFWILGQYQQAIDCYREAVRIRPEYAAPPH